MKKGFSNLNVILTLFLLVYIIFVNKFIYLAPNLYVSISLFVYAFTFLIPILIFNKYSLKEAKKAILYSALFVFIFQIVVTILCNIPPHIDNLIIDNALRELFTPNTMVINNFVIFYPLLFNFTFLIVYILSHILLLSIYDAIKSFANMYIGFAIAVFIAFIVDTMFMVPLYHTSDLYYRVAGLIDIIRYLTANFMIVILCSTILALTFPLFNKDKKDS